MEATREGREDRESASRNEEKVRRRGKEDEPVGGWWPMCRMSLIVLGGPDFVVDDFSAGVGFFLLRSVEAVEAVRDEVT